MQITLNQNEIETAIVKYIGSQGISISGRTEVSLKAGRGETGMSATVDIVQEDEITESCSKVEETCDKEAPQVEKDETPEEDKDDTDDSNQSLFGQD